MRLRTSNLNEEQPMQASKWLKCQALLEVDEMESLLNEMGEPLYIFITGSITKPGEELISRQEFLNHYSTYIKALKSGSLPQSQEYRKSFSSILTSSAEMLYSVPAGSDQQLVRVAKPVIQMQAHSLDYSFIDGKFRPMIMGTDSILWGIQFSYPQIYQDNKTHEVEQVADSPAFPNTHLFRLLQKWMRHHTIPTPFLVEQKVINVPMRIGKNCLSWINNHPQLVKKGIQVKI